MSLAVIVYNLKRMMNVLGRPPVDRRPGPSGSRRVHVSCTCIVFMERDIWLVTLCITIWDTFRPKTGAYVARTFLLPMPPGRITGSVAGQTGGSWNQTRQWLHLKSVNEP
jgi:hypothetical protein